MQRSNKPSRARHQPRQRGYPAHESKAAYALGGFVAGFWSVAQERMPASFSIADYREQCETWFGATYGIKGTLPTVNFLEGFTNEVALRTSRGTQGFEDAHEIQLALDRAAADALKQAEKLAMMALEIRTSLVAADAAALAARSVAEEATDADRPDAREARAEFFRAQQAAHEALQADEEAQFLAADASLSAKHAAKIAEAVAQKRMKSRTIAISDL